jgi:hypothetical protein
MNITGVGKKGFAVVFLLKKNVTASHWGRARSSLKMVSGYAFGRVAGGRVRPRFIFNFD